jgi:hypothetical protein
MLARTRGAAEAKRAGGARTRERTLVEVERHEDDWLGACSLARSLAGRQGGESVEGNTHSQLMTPTLLRRIREELQACLFDSTAPLFRVPDSLPPATPVLDTPFLVEVAAAAVFSSVLCKMRPSATAELVDPAHAALALRGERYMMLDGEPLPLWDQYSGMYATKDGSLIQAHCNFKHHRDAWLTALGLVSSASVQEARSSALGFPSAVALEQRVIDLGGAACAVRSPPAAQESTELNPVLRTKLIDITRIGECTPRAIQSAAQLKVLDFTRVLAGPVLTSVLAECGADVLTITSKGLPQIEPARLHCGRGKRSATMDLKADSASHIKTLLTTSDVVVQNMRPGAFDQLLADVGLDRIGHQVPGVILVDIAAYSPAGTWANRRGFDSLVQCATGMFQEQSEWAGEPTHLPVQALDHLTGLLGALGVLACVEQRARSGGSFRVSVNLERTAVWLQSLPRRPARELGGLQEIHRRLLSVVLEQVALADGRVLRRLQSPLETGLEEKLRLQVEATMGAAVAQWRRPSAL